MHKADNNRIIVFGASFVNLYCGGGGEYTANVQVRGRQRLIRVRKRPGRIAERKHRAKGMGSFAANTEMNADCENDEECRGTGKTGKEEGRT